MLLMLMLRLDSERFGTAEYYEATGAGERPRVRRRLAWYGSGRSRARDLHHPPAAAVALFLGIGDRLGAVSAGRFWNGRIVDSRVTTIDTGRIRFPDERSYPGPCSLDRDCVHRRGAFRGALFGLLITSGLDPTAAT